MGKTRRYEKEWGKNPKFKRDKKRKKLFSSNTGEDPDFNPAYNNLDRIREEQFENDGESNKYYT